LLVIVAVIFFSIFVSFTIDNYNNVKKLNSVINQQKKTIDILKNLDLVDFADEINDAKIILLTNDSAKNFVITHLYGMKWLSYKKQNKIKLLIEVNKVELRKCSIYTACRYR